MLAAIIYSLFIGGLIGSLYLSVSHNARDRRIKRQRLENLGSGFDAQMYYNQLQKRFDALCAHLGVVVIYRHEGYDITERSKLPGPGTGSIGSAVAAGNSHQSKNR